MKGPKLGKRICADVKCGRRFSPKNMGYNAKFCSQTCKRRTRVAREKAKDLLAYRAKRKVYIEKWKKNRRPELKAKWRGRINAYRAAIREWLCNYKMKRGCVDCGYKKHFAALQLDHEGKKTLSISHARSSLARLKAEIKNGKCKVRCGNCHAIKTWERKMAAKRKRESEV